jgi:hypothetical protein
MAAITIPLSTPAERPEVTPKTFNEIYIMDLAIAARSMGEQDSIYVEYVPYDQVTGDRLLSDRREVRLPFWEVVQAVPTAGAAFAAVATCLPDLIAYQEAKNNPPVEPVAPVAPAEPAEPVAPVAPVEPAAPVEPVEP